MRRLVDLAIYTPEFHIPWALIYDENAHHYVLFFYKYYHYFLIIIECYMYTISK